MNEGDALATPVLAFATSNAHKVSELRAILDPFVPGVHDGHILTLAQAGADEPVEDGITFEDNALIKARHLCELTGLPTIADDSGITVDVLGGAPGIFSARWSGHHGDDAANLDLLLAQIADVPDRHRGAAFVSAAVLVTPDGQTFVERGEVHGHLLRERHGSGGFGYDPIFVPDGFECTTAQMSPEDKNAISHRGIAFRALAPHVARVLAS